MSEAFWMGFSFTLGAMVAVGTVTLLVIVSMMLLTWAKRP